uniref:TonB-dependent receptor domain-containing protein n=3 Tax=Roseivirga sp. TaxID=1964215 RepID=UPI004048250C
MRKSLLQFVLAGIMLAISAVAYGQGTTTSSLNGKITDAAGAPLPGATVVAIHTPSGSQYGNVSNADGFYRIPNMRVGGPYTVTVTFVGFQEYKQEGLNLQLGQSVKLDVKLYETTITLSDIEVVADKNPIFDGNRTGASNNLSVETINALPTINRSINDFTRTTPQSNGAAFAGTSSRFNNYTIDGNIYNNNFGLGSGQFAGSNPISLDAIEEIQVNLAPYDVRLSGFTGASVNAITRSGTNEFSGSAYYFLRNDQMIGDKVGDTRLPIDDSQNQIQGFRIGGPIIKDKLFFFVNYETEEEEIPSFTKRALRPGETPDGLTISRVPAALLQNVSNRLSELYGYETGPFEGYSFASEQERFNIRLDYNINRDHKFSIRYNDYTAFNDVPTNANSTREVTRFRNTSRTGIEAMNFRNTNYTNDRNVKSIVAELNSVLSPTISNQLNIGYTSVADPKRGIPGDQAFPFIEVLEPDAGGNLLYYFSVGNELFTVGNLLENRVFNITDNLTIFKGRHTFTAGFNFEYMTFDNAFNPVFNGFYRFNSYQSFEDAIINKIPGTYPDAFAKSFAFDGSSTPPTDQTKFGQIGIYGQDEFQVNDRLKLTAGLRIDLPFYPIDLPRNELVDDLNKRFVDQDGETVTPDVSAFPKVNPLFSPRVGVNWDVKGDKTMQVRGGTGVFSGRIPFVWLSNQVNGSGVVRGLYGLENAQVDAAFGPGWIFNPDVTFGNPTNPSANDLTELNLTDRNFKLPQVWRTNAAIDKKLPFGILGTLEMIYSRDISTPIATNLTLRAPDGILNGPDQRPFWNGPNYTNDGDFNNAYYLTNAVRKADYYSFTFQFQKSFDNGLSAMAAYTRSRSRDLDAAGGSQASSLWANTVQTDRNNPNLSYAGFDIPNRVIGSLSYKVANSSMSIFYEGQANGRFSYTYSSSNSLDFGDDANRLIYVPNSASELNFQEFTLNGQIITAAQQAQILDAYIDQDDYLNGIRGQVAERNGAIRPWLNRVDLRLLQDIMLTADNRNKLQFSIDILNVGNLLKSTWGVSEFQNQAQLLNFRGRNANNEPIYRLNTVPGTTNFPTKTFRTSTSLGDTWRMQVGVRYIFN